MSESETERLPREQRGRQEYLDGLEEYITTCQADITNMLDKLDWTPEHFMKARNLCVCPHSEGHQMPQSSLEKHKKVCQLVTQGCTKEEAERIVADSGFQYEGASCVYTVKLDKTMLNSVLWNHHMQNQSVFYGIEKMPLTPDEEEQMLSREDRLGMAEYIIKRAKEVNRLKELGRDELLVSENLADLIRKDTEERKLDPVEEMAALRDYRRRRQTYRAKNVHITKKSHTEIMREVIANQMEMYAKSLTGEEGSVAEEGSLTGDRTRDSWTQEEPDENRKDKDKHLRDRERDHYRDRERTRDRETGRESAREKDRENRRDREGGRESKSDRNRHSRKDRYEEEGYSRHGEKSRTSSKHEADRRELHRRDGDSDRSRSRVRDDTSKIEREAGDFENQNKTCEQSTEKPGMSGHGTTEGNKVGEIDVKREELKKADNVDQTVSELEEGEVSGRGDVESKERSHSRSRSKQREKEKKRKKHKHRRSRSRSASSDRSSRKKHKKQKHKHRRKEEERDSETGTA